MRCGVFSDPPSIAIVLLCSVGQEGQGKAKGFGASPTTEEAPKKQKASAAAAAPEQAEPSSPPPSGGGAAPPGGGTNAGQRALAELRRQRAEERDAELRRVRGMLDADRQLREAPATIPEPVARRMGRRMLPFVGLPLFLGVGAFAGFWYLATYKNMDFEPSLVAGSTIAILVFGLLVRWQRVVSVVAVAITLDSHLRINLSST